MYGSVCRRYKKEQEILPSHIANIQTSIISWLRISVFLIVCEMSTNMTGRRFPVLEVNVFLSGNLKIFFIGVNSDWQSLVMKILAVFGHRILFLIRKAAIILFVCKRRGKSKKKLSCEISIYYRSV